MLICLIMTVSAIPADAYSGASEDVMKEPDHGLGGQAGAGASIGSYPPLRIDGDAELAAMAVAQGWPGAGTVGDPFVIESLRFIAPKADVTVYIGNTSSYLVLRNLTIFMAANNGIVLHNTRNVVVEECTVVSGSYAINIEDSSDYMIRDNEIREDWYGISLTLCSNGSVQSNSLSNVYFGGITLTSCHGVSVEENSISNCTDDGIALYSSTNNSLKGNILVDCWKGIRLHYASDNNILQNQLVRSELYMDGSNGNTLIHNTLLGDQPGDLSAMMQISASSDNLFRENAINKSDIFIDYFSNNNLFIGNSISNSGTGLRIQTSAGNVLWSNVFKKACIELGADDEHRKMYQTITSNNTVDGRPIYYYKNANMANATVPLDAGQVLVDNVTYLNIQDLELRNLAEGVTVSYSYHIRVHGNSFTGMEGGISLSRTNDSEVSDNILTASGLYLSGSNNNSIEGNFVSDCTGIFLHGSIYNEIEDNTLHNASISLTSGINLLFDDPLADLMYSQNNISTNNTVNGKPVYFFRYANMLGASAPADAGQIILAYVTNFRIQDLDLSEQFGAIRLWHCSNVIIENLTCDDSSSALSLEWSDDCVVQNCAFRNTGSCIVVEGSNNILDHNRIDGAHSPIRVVGSHNQVSSNEISGAEWDSIELIGSHNRVQNNLISDCTIGIMVGGDSNIHSEQNTLTGNEIANCSTEGIRIRSSNLNLLQSNLISSSAFGISIQGYRPELFGLASNNRLYANTLTGCSLTLVGDFSTMGAQIISPNNTVNAKPVYYYANADLGNTSVPSDAGQIILVNVDRLLVHDLALSDQSTGLYAVNCSFITVTDCRFLNDSVAGIDMKVARDCTVQRSEFSNCSIGADISSVRATVLQNHFVKNDKSLLLRGSSSLVRANTADGSGGVDIYGTLNLIEHNLIEGSLDLWGMEIEGSLNLIEHNSISNSTSSGLSVAYSSQNTVRNNTIMYSGSYGIVLQYSSDNLIEMNTLVGNNGCGPAFDQVHPQAMDDQMNRWNGSLGNYWSDRTGPDLNRDGMVDVPYPIAGSGLSSDELPLASPVGVPYGLIAILNAGSVELSWTGVNYSLPGPIEGFTLYRYSPEEGSTSFDLAPSARNYSDTSVQPSYTYTYHLTARAGGYQSGPSPSVTVVVPGQHPGPIVNITSPQDQSTTNQTSIEVHWTGSDQGSIAYYWIRLDSASWQNATTSTSWPFEGLANGLHSVVVKAFNQTGGNGSDSVSFTVDTLAPSIVIVAPLEGSFRNTSTTSLTWNAADPGSGIQGCRYRVDGGGWSSMTSSSTATISTLSDGGHRIEVQAFDNAHNHAIVVVNLTIDTVLPSVTILSPSNGKLFNVTSLNVAWTANGTGSQLSTVRTRADDGAWTLWSPATMQASFTSLAEGEHELFVKVTDMAGNAREASVRLTVDTVAPQVIAHEPTGSSVEPSSALSVTFSEAMNRSSVSITVPEVAGSVSWSGNKLTFTPSSNLAPGDQYTATVRGADLAGNRVQYQWSFTAASQSPNPGYDWLWLLILLIILIIIGIAVYEWRKRKLKARK